MDKGECVLRSNNEVSDVCVLDLKLKTLYTEIFYDFLFFFLFFFFENIPYGD